LVGTSTNLVVSGYLQKDYPGTPAGDIGLFDVGVYGVPNMFIGMVYMLIFSPLLLPYGKINLNAESDAILLGARVYAMVTSRRVGQYDDLVWAIRVEFILSMCDALPRAICNMQ
jgi:hypothetical protein